MTYARRIKSDATWKKLLRMNPGKPFFFFVTPIDIAYMLSIIKNGMGMWNQAIRMLQDLTKNSR